MIDCESIINTNIYQFDQSKLFFFLTFKPDMIINVRSSLQLVSLASPIMKQNDREAKTKDPNIVVLTSAGGVTPIPGSLTHCVGASMTNMMVQCAALETAYHGIRVNAVAPGITATAARMKQDSIKFSRDENLKFLKENSKDVPLNQKVNDTKDVADAICWLASQDASFITGEILVVDGGQSVTTNRYDDYLKDLQSQRGSMF